MSTYTAEGLAIEVNSYTVKQAIKDIMTEKTARASVSSH